jgi:HlyD family secretion protein
VAEASHKVAQAEERRLAALVGYTKLIAPYDGVVVARNANTGDFVVPAGGDHSAPVRSADQASTKAAPIFVVARVDVVRVYVDVPEADANFVQKGTKATVEIRALQHDPISASVTRTSWSLHVKSRTLRAEIDLPNLNEQLLPGMYAYGRIVVDHPNVRVVPRQAVVELGEQTYCYVAVDGKAVRTAVQTGLSDDNWIEVVGKESKPKSDGKWIDFTGQEKIVIGDLTELSDGQKIDVES